MRTILFLALAVTFTGCQHTQRCMKSCRFDPPSSACNKRDPGNCCEQKSSGSPYDIGAACRNMRSSCEKVCRSSSCLGDKRVGLGWKECRVPVLKLKSRQSSCRTGAPCDSRGSCSSIESCGSKSPCDKPAVGCCQESPTRPNQATPFLTLPPQQQSATQQRSGITTNDLARRTQTLESQVSEIRSMIRQPPAGPGYSSGYQQHGRAHTGRGEVIMLPPPAWRTMDGVPPVPDTGIEQTGASGLNSGTYRTAHDPQMWPHSPQNIRR